MSTDRPPTSPISVLLFLAGIASAIGWAVQIIGGTPATRVIMLAAGTASTLAVFALASIVESVSRSAWYAERTASHAKRTADELSRMSQKRHSGSPAKAGTN